MPWAEYIVNGKNSKKKKKNSKQAGEALELLSNLENNSADLVFLDPQYEPVKNVLKLDYPLFGLRQNIRYIFPQSDYQIMRILEQAERVLKSSSFCLLWINKGLLGSDRIAAWMIKAPGLKIVDCLVWYKKNTLGLGTWLRSNAEFCFLLQKYPTTGKRFTNRSFGTVWEENSLPSGQRKHPHQKPRELIRALIMATTNEGDLIVDPCAGRVLLCWKESFFKNFVQVILLNNANKFARS